MVIHIHATAPVPPAHSIQIRHGHKAQLMYEPILPITCSLSTSKELQNKDVSGLVFLFALPHQPLPPPPILLRTPNWKSRKEELWTIRPKLVCKSLQNELCRFFFFFSQWKEISRLVWIFICTSSIRRVFRLAHLFPATSCNFQRWLLHSKSGQHNLHVLISDSSTYLKILRMNHIYMFAEFLLLPVKEGLHWRTVEQSSRQESLWCLGTLYECTLSEERI